MSSTSSSNEVRARQTGTFYNGSMFSRESIRRGEHTRQLQGPYGVTEQVVTAHGGGIWFEPTQDGTTFFIRLEDDAPPSR